MGNQVLTPPEETAQRPSENEPDLLIEADGSMWTSLLANLNAALKQTQLAPINQLVLVSQLDNAISRQGNLYNQQATLDEQLAFAKEVESAKVITPARSVKTVARTRSTSVVVGAVIGLIVGAILAIVGDGRRAARAA